MAWGTRIFELADKRGWSDSQLARELDVSRSTLYRLKNGDTEPSGALIRKAHTLFGEETGVLFWPLPDDQAVPA